MSEEPENTSNDQAVRSEEERQFTRNRRLAFIVLGLCIILALILCVVVYYRNVPPVYKPIPKGEEVINIDAISGGAQLAVVTCLDSTLNLYLSYDTGVHYTKYTSFSYPLYKKHNIGLTEGICFLVKPDFRTMVMAYTQIMPNKMLRTTVLSKNKESAKWDTCQIDSFHVNAIYMNLKSENIYLFGSIYSDTVNKMDADWIKDYSHIEAAIYKETGATASDIHNGAKTFRRVDISGAQAPVTKGWYVSALQSTDDEKNIVLMLDGVKKDKITGTQKIWTGSDFKHGAYILDEAVSKMDSVYMSNKSKIARDGGFNLRINKSGVQLYYAFSLGGDNHDTVYIFKSKGNHEFEPYISRIVTNRSPIQLLYDNEDTVILDDNNEKEGNKVSYYFKDKWIDDSILNAYSIANFSYLSPQISFTKYCTGPYEIWHIARSMGPGKGWKALPIFYTVPDESSFWTNHFAYILITGILFLLFIVATLMWWNARLKKDIQKQLDRKVDILQIFNDQPYKYKSK